MKQRFPVIFILLFAIGLMLFFVWPKFSKLTIENNIIVDDTKLNDVELEQKKEIEPTQPTLIKLAPVVVVFEDGTQSKFELAQPFRLAVAAEGLGKARFMALSSDERIFVPDLVNLNLSHEGKIYILENFDETTKQFQTKTTYLSGLRGPNSIAFYTDKNGQEWIYIALTANIIRYPYNTGDIKPTVDAEIITTFPNRQVPGETSIVWHITRTIKFYNDRLYVSVGSGCNACEQPEGEMRAMIYSMNPDGSDKQIYVDGLRNAVGFAWADGKLYATANGVDHLGSQAPDDVMYKLVKDEFYGWPYCYESNGKIYSDTSRKWTRLFSCEEVPLSFSAFEPHAAPLGIEYFPENAHPALKNTFLVALHGSFDSKIRVGYHIVRVSKNGEQEIFMDGFLTENNKQTRRIINTAYAHGDQSTGNMERFGRPVDILQKDANSFFFTDDYKGRIYYVYADIE